MKDDAKCCLFVAAGNSHVGSVLYKIQIVFLCFVYFFFMFEMEGRGEKSNYLR